MFSSFMKKLCLICFVVANIHYSLAVDGDWSIAGSLSHVESFGYAIAADGVFVVVGNYLLSEPSVYIFEKQDDGSSVSYVPQHKFTGPSGSRYGSSVAIHADTIVVGAPAYSADNSNVEIGAIYMYTYASSTWSQQAMVPASSTTTSFEGAVSTLAPTPATLIRRPTTTKTDELIIYERRKLAALTAASLVGGEGGRFGSSVAILRRQFIAVGANYTDLRGMTH
jgi:hypothetical protein